MKLGSLCAAPCFPEAPMFDIAAPGCGANDLKFGTAQGRDYYAVLLRNHDLTTAERFDPRVAIVGLSPAGNQIAEFVSAYRSTRDYGSASIAGAFAGLSRDIIAMMNGLGLSAKLGMSLTPQTSFARHPDFYVTSLIACASLTTSGSSTDFDPRQFDAARRCMTERFLGEMLNPAFTRLSHVVILGSKGWKAVNTVHGPSGKLVHRSLTDAGKHLVNLPHPSGANQEYVKLASLSASAFPDQHRYADEMWCSYRDKPLKDGKLRMSDAQYRAKRLTVWSGVNALRQQIAAMEPVA